MGAIRDAFNSAWPDGPSTNPTRPNKSTIRQVGTTIETSLVGAAAGLIRATTKAGLGSGTRTGQPGQVTAGADKGEYYWNGSAWIRTGDVIDPIALQANIDEEVDERSSLIARGMQNIPVAIKDALGFIWAYIDNRGYVKSRGFSAAGFEMGSSGADEVFHIRDRRGFKYLSLTKTELRAPGLSHGSNLNEGFDAKPLIGGTLVSFVGDETHLFVRNILTQRSDLSRIRATLYSEASLSGIRASYSRTGDDDLVVDLAKCSQTVTLQTRLDEVTADTRNATTLNAISVPVSPSSGNTVRALMIGDSITNRQMAARMNIRASQRGYTINFVGTLNGAGVDQGANDATGPLGEGREGWEFGDFTYAVTNRATVIAPGSEASYLAAAKTSKQTQNPFLRAATGGDSSSVVRNGYVFDYAFYLSRFSLTAPNVVFIGLGTNDIRDLSSSELGPGILDGLTIMCGQILAAQPTTKIVLWFPPVSRSSERDALWSSRYVEVLTRFLRFVRTQANASIRIVPTWAMASQEVGFELAAGSTSDIGIKTAELSDAVHLGPYNIAAVAEVLAAAAGAAAQETL
ncbi:hypothetical protein SAMN03159496_04622 [Rhizobium sp. NFR07]|uniref:SGNH/GDSL hydrolase family protein n=1 Tax=Rhizobium sp. NFR07 TaxID=1566262 RepID=UPI0008E4A4FB|nr:SGNH/GDSL hydrolase family protein [Rhizobium sp. NFR07]SFB52228.1 hypothetical protein SAMN03159496_04622 [Rhizobium sp. NFR07]